MRFDSLLKKYWKNQTWRSISEFCLKVNLMRFFFRKIYKMHWGDDKLHRFRCFEKNLIIFHFCITLCHTFFKKKKKQIHHQLNHFFLILYKHLFLHHAPLVVFFAFTFFESLKYDNHILELKLLHTTVNISFSILRYTREEWSLRFQSFISQLTNVSENCQW